MQSLDTKHSIPTSELELFWCAPQLWVGSWKCSSPCIVIQNAWGTTSRHSRSSDDVYHLYQLSGPEGARRPSSSLSGGLLGRLRLSKGQCCDSRLSWKQVLISVSKSSCTQFFSCLLSCHIPIGHPPHYLSITFCRWRQQGPLELRKLPKFIQLVSSEAGFSQVEIAATIGSYLLGDFDVMMVLGEKWGGEDRAGVSSLLCWYPLASCVHIELPAGSPSSSHSAGFLPTIQICRVCTQKLNFTSGRNNCAKLLNHLLLRLGGSSNPIIPEVSKYFPFPAKTKAQSWKVRNDETESQSSF
jgi:hypothetical protein